MHYSHSAHRIEFLDGLRGLAVSLVVLFHAYARWPDVVPYGGAFAHIKVFSYGWLGVQLFFLISGFVIFLTLDRCASLSEFLGRRWLRLFPAMLIASLFVWYTAGIFPERPAGSPTSDQLVPGLLFIDPQWLQLAGIHARPIEGAFWSLFVEAQFYLIAGFSYFVLGGKRSAILILLLFFVLAIFIGRLQGHLGDNKIFHYLAALLGNLGAQHYGWFAGGAILYVYFTRKSLRALVLGLATITVAVVMVRGYREAVAPALIAAVFVGALLSRYVQFVLSRRWLLCLGFISYPLYLLHENMMVASIVKVGTWAPEIPAALMPFAPIGLVIFFAWLVATYLEPAIRTALRAGYAVTLAATKRLPA